MPPEDTPALKEALDRAFEESHGELRTGFVGTAYLCRVLSHFGLNNRAYDLFLHEEYPGWLYEVKMGATTVWERWNSVLPDGHMSGTGMNSLNHYAYGAVMEWVFSDAAGLSPIKAGFRSARMAPHPDPRLGKLDFAYESAVGRWRSAWQVTCKNGFDWQITVPFGAEAELVLPEAEVTGCDFEWKNTDGVMTCTVCAGEYVVHVSFKHAPWEPLLIDIPLNELMEDDEMRALIRACAPSLETVPDAQKLLAASIRKMRGNHRNPLPIWEQKRLETALCAKCFGKA
jgi:alpha-L-rhamnosidase